MYKIIKCLNFIKNYFFISSAPIGLTEIGLKMNYLDNVNNFNYNKINFYLDILYPVKTPYFFDKV